MGDSYAALWVKTSGSFLEGASQPEELVERAHALGLPAMAVTDRDGVYGLVRAHVKAGELGQRIVVGSDATLDGGGHVVMLAESRAGYGAMCKLLTVGHTRDEKGKSKVTVDEVREAAAGGLVVLADDPDVLEALGREGALDGRLYALCARHLVPDEGPDEERLRARARVLGVPTVAAVEVLYHDVARRRLADVLSCIRHGVRLGEAGTKIRANAEHALPSAMRMRELFADDVASVERTLEIAERCRFSLAEIRYRYPGERIPDGLTERDWLRELTFAGARERYSGEPPDDVRAQLERELSLIQELDYGGYFLTMWEIVQFCRREGILCQGRGSAANSAVCFCLGITAIDPVRMDLLFERFLSRERAEPPDIDLDIEHERREEVIQWVYARYGRRHSAMVANLVRYRAKSAVRDVGKALGLEETSVDRVARLLSYFDETVGGEVLAQSGLDPSAPAHKLLLELGAEIQDFPRHLSIHPGGFLLGHEPVDELVPVEPATMENRTVIQWDKYDVEALGLFKVDLLGLGCLTHIRKTLDLLRVHEGVSLDIANIPHEDAPTYDMISRGDTVGVFQIESRAQMAMLPRLRPRTFYDLVIEVAIVRPGPIQGDMVHPYLRRRAGEEPVEVPHPKLERVLAKTMGVPIFQEQVMKLAVLVAGYTGGEADQLRRDMAAWRSAGRIEKHYERIVGGMEANGITREFAERVFSQIRGFGEYGFPESHAASFALLAYVTAWLRRHHLAAFTCGLLNAQPMGFYTASTIVEDARRHGVEILPIDVNYSSWDCTLQGTDLSCLSFAEAMASTEHVSDSGAAKLKQLKSVPRFVRDHLAPVVRGQLAPAARRVRMGLRYVKGLGERERERLELEPPPYVNLAEFVRRTRLAQKHLVALAESGAFECFGLNRRDALWAVRGLAASLRDPLPLPAAPVQPTFPATSFVEDIAWDYRRSQHSTRGHPMQALREVLRARGLPEARTVQRSAPGKPIDFIGLVICRQRPGTASGVTFYTLEDETGFVNVVVWRHVFERFELLAKTASLLGVSGRIQTESGVTHLIADRLFAPDLTLTTSPRSRDFH